MMKIPVPYDSISDFDYTDRVLKFKCSDGKFREIVLNQDEYNAFLEAADKEKHIFNMVKNGKAIITCNEGGENK